MKVKLYVWIILCCWGIPCSAQSFKWQASIGEVPVSGFYNIAVTPELLSRTEGPSLTDIRIFEKKKEIAWLLSAGTDSTDTAGTLHLAHYSRIPLDALKTQEIKAKKQSVVTLLLQKAYRVDKLKLGVEGPRFYRREAWLAEPNPDVKPKRHDMPYNRLVSFIISSDRPAIIELPGKNRYKQLLLIIENEDNTPLSIKNIELYQQNLHLTAYLEKDKRYVIKTGQANMNFPRYDLDYFHDSIGRDLSFVEVGNFSKSYTAATTEKSHFASKNWLWVALTILIVFIGYLSYRMINEMQGKKTD